jgi:HSP20 family protein
MSLIPYNNNNPFRQMESFRQGMNDLFNDAFFNFMPSVQGPRIDVYDSGNEVVASCEIPGLKNKDDVRIEIHDDILSISGSINRSQEVSEEQMHRKERFIGRFQRSIRLPHNVSPENSSASYKNGILEIRMPRVGASKQQVIDVNFQ